MPGHPGFILRPLPKEEVFTGKPEGRGPSQVALMVKNLPAKAGDRGDAGSIPDLGRSLREDTATSSSVLAWRIPWTENLAGCRPWGPKESDMTEVT